MTITKRYDLHCHSTVSDGTFTSKELIDLAVSLELAGISITDHDTVDAYTNELLAYTKERNIELIPGVEFSSHFEGTGVHILGYCFDIHNQGLRHFCERHKERRTERNRQILALLKNAGMELNEYDLRDSLGVVGRPHIATAMIRKGYVADLGEAFRVYIGDGKPCFSPGNRFSLEETINIIHGAGGKAVLAHPILLKKRSLIRKILERPFDGMECFYANFSAGQNNEMSQIAERNGHLVQTGGSDFHGTIKAHTNLGSAYTTLENLEKLRRAQS